MRIVISLMLAEQQHFGAFESGARLEHFEWLFSSVVVGARLVFFNKNNNCHVLLIYFGIRPRKQKECAKKLKRTMKASSNRPTLRGT